MEKDFEMAKQAVVQELRRASNQNQQAGGANPQDPLGIFGP